jgi:ligand-binding sensor domain-containing protein
VVRHSIMIVLSLSLLVVLVIVGGCGGLEVTTYTSGNWTTFAIDNEPPGSVVTAVTQDNQGLIWVGRLEGLMRFDGNSWEIYNGSMRNMDIICATRDEQGNLWFGTWGQGVFEYTGTEWRNFTPDNTGGGLPGVGIKDILVDNQGKLWFPTTGNLAQRTAPIDYGVTRYDGTNWTSFMDGTDVETVFQDTDGNMWFGTNVGVIRYDGSHWQTFTEEDGLADDYVVAICQDSQCNMWFGTWSSGVSRYDGENWRTFTPSDGMVSDAMHCMLKDSRGDLWFGSYSIDGYHGISRFNGTQWQNFDPWQGKSNLYSVSSIFEDNEGNLWFTTSFGPVRYRTD